MRVDYRVGFNDYRSEWVCFEHTGYARGKAEAWWRPRSNEPVPDTVEQAVAICEAGGVAPTLAITVRSVAGEKYDRIVNHQLGPIPPRLDGSDEHDDGDLPEPMWPLAMTAIFPSEEVERMVCATECGIIVDEEFRSLIPPLTDEERAGLEENLLRDGCLEPLIVWAERQILLDGHNRKDICDRYGIDYEIRELSLPDREAAADWIDAHQLGRRNLTPEQMSLLRGRRYNRLKKDKAGRQSEADAAEGSK